MEPLLFSKRLLGYMDQDQKLDMKRKRELAKGTIKIVGDFLYDFYVPSSWHLEDIERRGDSVLVFHWTTDTNQAVCSECQTLSNNKVNLYLTREIQDLPISGMTVYHSLKASRYHCDNLECPSKTFIEQFYEIADKDARLSNRLKDFVVREAIESSCNGTSRTLRKVGIRVSADTINREVKKKGALVVAQNLKRHDVKILAVDDINLRKGNSSTACSVFIDAETHRVLVIVQGATSEIAEKVMALYPSVEIVSRDRGTAFAAAASKLGKPQVADGFHLVQNVHQAIKDALSLELAHDLFVREGDGWITMVDSAAEKSGPDTTEPDNSDSLLVIRPAVLAAEDIERRIHLAGINKRQANKYKKTLKIIDMAEGGMRTPEIAKRLSMTALDVRNYRKNAPETIEHVELKVDEYYKMHEQGQWEYHQKTITKKAKSAVESIVEPYKETVLQMLKEGKTHRQIHPVIVQQGFKGCSNAVYQYIIKYAHENNIPYGINSRVIPLEDRNYLNVLARPPRISIERTSRHTLYQCLLYVAATRKEEIKQALLGLEADHNDSQTKNQQHTSKEWINKTGYSDSIAKIIFDTRSKAAPVKKNQKKK